ncbi:cysteine dioxygenase [Pseudoroseomonas rhizosphaerae]|uniref:Cysteine dioxygenase n=1 Tax=Teichococcus rhizosphaerae TaxID=1335062 RepID=A0A2C7AGS4_9PROT|nr:cysteine dioxygenase family protein [Pseudoroseomonas rhizosphaerae]PHK96903.1 cysteine dioxygenase [Pseudoroseomonas rhizosphaerae]
MSFIAPQGPLAAMLADIAAAARAGDEAERPGRVAAAIAPWLAVPELLAPGACPCDPKRYVRHLLQADPQGGYAVVALAWRPGQMSPVHAHRTWCALGVYRGTLTEGHYVAGAEGAPRQTGSVLRPPGATCHGPADPGLIHRLANLGGEEAVSIHVYGVPFDRFGSDVNLVYAD